MHFHQTLSSTKGYSVLWQEGCSCSAIDIMKWGNPCLPWSIPWLNVKSHFSSYSVRHFRHFVLSRVSRRRTFRKPTVNVSIYFWAAKNKAYFRRPLYCVRKCQRMDCDANLLQCRQFSLNVSQESAGTGQGRINVSPCYFEPNPWRKKCFHHRLGEKK